MSDEDRMQLMILVKEGRISMQQAVDAVGVIWLNSYELTLRPYTLYQVKQFEAERRHASVERDSSEDHGICMFGAYNFSVLLK